MRTALKERQKTRDVAAYRHPRISRGLYCSAFERFFRSFRATRLFTTNTQGSAKPPPRLRKAYVAATRRGVRVLKPNRARRSLRRRPGLSSCTPSDFAIRPQSLATSPGASSDKSAFSTFPCSYRFQPAPKAFRGQHSLFNALLTNHFGCRYAALFPFAAISFGRAAQFHRKNASGSPPSTAIT